MRLFPFLIGAATLCAASCQTILHPRAIEAPALASAKVASDYQTYHLKRVGVLPVDGGEISADESRELQHIVFNEFNELVDFELVMLSRGDLAEVVSSEPYLRGGYRGETVLGISKRFNLDGILVTTVSQRQSYPPQKLNMQADLVATETGMTIWHGAVTLQADRPEVRLGVEAYYGNGLPMSDDSWTSALLSPSRFARFGVWQLARTM